MAKATNAKRVPERQASKTPRVPTPPEFERTHHNCNAREMLVRVGDKWSVYVISILDGEGRMRFNELRASVEGISQRMLTVTLRGLERDGLVKRTVHAEIPPRVEYELTPLGSTLRKLVRGLIDWSGAHLEEVDAARAAYDAREARGTRGERVARGERAGQRPTLN